MVNLTRGISDNKAALQAMDDALLKGSELAKLPVPLCQKGLHVQEPPGEITAKKSNEEKGGHVGEKTQEERELFDRREGTDGKERKQMVVQEHDCSPIAEGRKGGGCQGSSVREENDSINNRKVIEEGERALQPTSEKDNPGNKKDVEENLAEGKGGQVLYPGEEEGRNYGEGINENNGSQKELDGRDFTSPVAHVEEEGRA